MIISKRTSISLILIFSVFALALGLSLAYFSIRVLGNDSASNIDLKTANIVLSFVDDDLLNMPDVTPGMTVTKTFRVENNNNSEYNYSLVWTMIENGFSNRQLLTYSLTCQGFTDYQNRIESSTTCNGLNEAYSPGSSTNSVGIISNTAIPGNEVQEYVVTFKVSDALQPDTIASFGGAFGIAGGSVPVNHEFEP